MATNPWDAFPAVQAPGPVYGAPDPTLQFKQSSDVRDESRLGIEMDRNARSAQNEAARLNIEQQRLLLAQQEAARQAAKDKPAQLSAEDKASVLQEARNKLSLIKSLDERSRNGWFATGFGADTAAKLPATTAADVQKDIGTVSNAGALQRIMEMSAANGGKNPLTPLSNADFQALSSSIANLDPTQSDEQFQRNLGVYRDIYKRAFLAAGGTQPEVDAMFAPPAADDGSDDGLTGSVTDTGSGYDPGAAPPTAPTGGGGGGVTDGLLQGVGSLVEGAASIPAIVVDPLATTLGRALGYDNYTSDFAGQVRSDLGLPKNQDPVANTIIGGGVSALTGSLAARGASALATGVGRSALAAFGAAPGRDAVAGAGAGALGMVGQSVGGVPGQVAGTLIGGMAGYGAANRAVRSASGVRQPNALMAAANRQKVDLLPADVGGVGTRMATGATGMTLGGIPLAEGAERSVGTVANARNRISAAIGDDAGNISAGQAARRGYKSFEKSSLARGGELFERVSVPAEAKVQLGQTRGALAEVTRGMQSNPELSKLWANHPKLRATLEALTPEDTRPAGQVRLTAEADRLRGVQASYDDAMKSARDSLTALQSRYDQLRPQVVGADVLNAARQEVAKAEAKYNAFRNNDASDPDVASALKPVQEAKSSHDEAFVQSRQPSQGGELSWEDMKRFRSIVGEIVGQPGIAADGSDVAGLRKLYGALSSDMEVTAAKAGPKALQEFKRANQYWRGRESRLEDVFTSLFGNRDQKSDEAVFRTINNWAQSDKGDFSRLARTIRSMPDDEANTVRATIIQKLGQATPANGGAEVFAPDVFSTQWKSLSDRAKTVLFPNKQHRQDLEDVAMLTAAMKRAGSYRNTSKTALGANFTATGLTAVSGPAGLLAAAAYSGGTFSLGKLLASPRVARAIASTKRMPEEKAARTLTQKLGVIAANDPGLRADAKGLQQYLQQAAGQSPASRAAASEQEQNRRREPPQQ